MPSASLCCTPITPYPDLHQSRTHEHKSPVDPSPLAVATLICPLPRTPTSRLIRALRCRARPDNPECTQRRSCATESMCSHQSHNVLFRYWLTPSTWWTTGSPTCPAQPQRGLLSCPASTGGDRKNRHLCAQPSKATKGRQRDSCARVSGVRRPTGDGPVWDTNTPMDTHRPPSSTFRHAQMCAFSALPPPPRRSPSQGWRRQP